MPLLRLDYLAALDAAGAAGWHWVDGTTAARTAARARDPAVPHRRCQSLDRSTGPLGGPSPWSGSDTRTVVLPAATVAEHRGPDDLDGELALLGEHSRIDVLVTDQDSGGSYTCRKPSGTEHLALASGRRRTPAPQAAVVVTASDPAAAAAWAAARAGH